jgi:hypothetical protein
MLVGGGRLVRTFSPKMATEDKHKNKPEQPKLVGRYLCCGQAEPPRVPRSIDVRIKIYRLHYL